MGFLWDAVKTIATKKAGEISSSVKADSLIKEVTGVNPRGYHGRMYAVVNSIVNEKHDWYFKNSATPLNDDEVAFYKLMFFYVFASDEGYDAAKEELREAVDKYRTTRWNLIRPEIISESWELPL
jgi:hypothetical protein